METTQKPIIISGLETVLLREYSKTAPLVLLRFKAQAILLAINGVAPAVMAAVFDRKPSTIEQWLKDWRQSRLSSIFTGHQDNSNAVWILKLRFCTKIALMGALLRKFMMKK